MELYDLIRKRRSIRKYQSIPVPKQMLAMILDAGNWAPSAGNLLSWKFILVQEAGTRTEVMKSCFDQVWMNSAPAFVVICADTTRIGRAYGIRGERLYAVQDCALAAMNMMLMAEHLDLGSCYVGAFHEGELRRALDIPENMRPQCVLTLGYPDEEVPIPAKAELQYQVFFEKYGKQEAVPSAAQALLEKVSKVKERLGKKVITK